MDIRHCYEILELKPDASIQDVKQAYKDLVNIWHPDRVPDNPRLKQKAEEKLKQINAAYEALISYLNSRQKGPVAVEEAPRPEPKKEDTAQQETRAYTDDPHRAETHVKTGPGILSTLWSHFTDLVHSLSDSSLSNSDRTGAEPYATRSGQGHRRDRGMGGGTGTGRGRGTGRGGGGLGRGKGTGMGRGRGRR